MKSALLLEYDEEAKAQAAGLLKSLGYLVACAATPDATLKTAMALRFDVVVTCTDFIADDRRSLIGELARLSPGTTIVYALDSDAAGPGYHDRACALLFKPLTLRSLRRVIEFGVDGLGMQSGGPLRSNERRDGQRRARVR